MPVSTPDYPSDKGDDANPYGIPRTGNLAKKKVYQDDPKTSRPMIPVRTKSRQRPMIAVGEGNNPSGMNRPRLPVNKDQSGKPYDQAMDPDYY
jgi:hypothetical protein